MRVGFGSWLERQGFDPGTISSRLSNVARIEEHYGCLDGHFEEDGLEDLIAGMTYSVEDERRRRPNPSRIPIDGVLRTGLATCRSALRLYRRFCEQDDRTSPEPTGSGRLRHLRPGTGRVRRAGPLTRMADNPRTLRDFGLDGRAALESVVASSQYRTVAQAIAALTLFSHPATVQQTGGEALFPSRRDMRRVGQIGWHEGRQVLFDDNKCATEAFLWANSVPRRGTDTQFNHVYSTSVAPQAYTSLANICMTPAFIAKLTDGSEVIQHLLRYRVYDLYGWVPSRFDPPRPPEGYDTLDWADPLPEVEDVRDVLVAAMRTKPKNRTVLAVAELGWLFGGPRGAARLEAAE